MAEYLISCVNTEHPHSHIVSAVVLKLLGNEYGDREMLEVHDIVAMMISGDTFNTYSPSTDKTADVHQFVCDIDGCKTVTLRSDPDVVADNNLDNLICS
jgi:hypothetical protein